MPTNNDLIFDPNPQLLITTYGELQIDTGEAQARIGITLLGPENLVRDYMDLRPIQIDIVPLDQFQVFADQIEGRRKNTDDPNTSRPSDVLGRALDINIEVIESSLDDQGYALRITVDPNIPQGMAHHYHLWASSVAASIIDTKGSDPRIDLSLVDGSRHIIVDRDRNGDRFVSARLASTRDICVRVFGRNGSGCSYELDAAFERIALSPFERRF